jgi:NAD(P)-dependent dehydrogenase (short-subunit alcohol dehydrogenase family)
VAAIIGLFNDVMQEYGGIDIVIANAGVGMKLAPYY